MTRIGQIVTITVFFAGLLFNFLKKICIEWALIGTYIQTIAFVFQLILFVILPAVVIFKSIEQEFNLMDQK